MFLVHWPFKRTEDEKASSAFKQSCLTNPNPYPEHLGQSGK